MVAGDKMHVIVRWSQGVRCTVHRPEQQGQGKGHPVKWKMGFRVVIWASSSWLLLFARINFQVFRNFSSQLVSG